MYCLHFFLLLPDDCQPQKAEDSDTSKDSDTFGVVIEQQECKSTNYTANEAPKTLTKIFIYFYITELSSSALNRSHPFRSVRSAVKQASRGTY